MRLNCGLVDRHVRGRATTVNDFGPNGRTAVFNPPLVVAHCFSYADVTRSGRIVRRIMKFSILVFSSDHVFKILGRTRITETFPNDNGCVGLLLVWNCFTTLVITPLLYICANLENRLKGIKCSLQNVLVWHWIFINKKPITINLNQLTRERLYNNLY